jgi:hypothetical protein
MSTPQQGQHQPQQAAGAQQSDSKGLPWGKLILGCGCLGLIVLMCGGGVAAYMLVGKAADESGVGDIVAMATGSKSPMGSSRDNSAEAKEIRKEAKKRKEAALQPGKVRGYLKEPITKKDLREHFDFVERWQEDPTYKKWVEEFEGFKEISEKNDDSISGQMRAVRQVGKTGRAASDVMEAFDEFVRDDGSYEDYYGRLTRIGGLLLASQAITESEKKLDDPDSDAVAKKMLAERPKVIEEYEKNIEEAKKAVAEAEQRGGGNKRSDPREMAARASLMGMAQGPATIAFVRMPEESFEMWADLSPDKRKEVRDLYKEGVAPGSHFGVFAVDHVALLLTAYASEIEEFEKLKDK